MDWMDTLKKIAPTVASALGGPLAGAAVEAIGGILGSPGADKVDIQKAIENGKLNAEQVADLRKLEMQYQENERERGFRYAELEFKDRDSARKASVEGGTLNKLFWLSIWLVLTIMVAELVVLFTGIPHGIPEIVVGRILGLMDSIAIQVLNFWFGTSSGSVRKTDMLQKQ